VVGVDRLPVRRLERLSARVVRLAVGASAWCPPERCRAAEKQKIDWGMSVSATEAVDRDTVAADFRKSMEGKLPEDKIDATVAALKTAATPIPAQATLVSAIFYLRVEVFLRPHTAGPTFSGNAGGIWTPVGGYVVGDIYTDDSARLFSNTQSFWLIATAVYVAVIFYDSSHTALGSFHGGGGTTVVGTGGGTGVWR
jgi:hypothetical protein